MHDITQSKFKSEHLALESNGLLSENEADRDDEGRLPGPQRRVRQIWRGFQAAERFIRQTLHATLPARLHLRQPQNPGREEDVLLLRESASELRRDARSGGAVQNHRGERLLDSGAHRRVRQDLRRLPARLQVAAEERLRLQSQAAGVRAVPERPRADEPGRLPYRDLSAGREDRPRAAGRSSGGSGRRCASGGQIQRQVTLFAKFKRFEFKRIIF